MGEARVIGVSSSTAHIQMRPILAGLVLAALRLRLGVSNPQQKLPKMFEGQTVECDNKAKAPGAANTEGPLSSTSRERTGDA